MKTVQAAIACAMFGYVIFISALPPVIKNPNGAFGCLSVSVVFFGAGTRLLSSTRNFHHLDNDQNLDLMNITIIDAKVKSKPCRVASSF